jgi:hypothetical protein
VDLVKRLVGICREQGVAQLNVEGVALIMGPDPRPLHVREGFSLPAGLPLGPDETSEGGTTIPGPTPDDPADPLFDAVPESP